MRDDFKPVKRPAKKYLTPNKPAPAPQKETPDDEPTFKTPEEVAATEEATEQKPKRFGESDALIALLTDKPSSGVQTEIGVAVALEKRVILAHLPKDELSYFNAAMLKAGVVEELTLPLEPEVLSGLA